uniref:Uncharacterized protein n=1 Tax=Physcomitrium patens TaxID=3218 RepID=A0A2K1K716_PHYPA|nr:hypothetical protein PHYPA_011467 [Physcomitrium patens]
MPVPGEKTWRFQPLTRNCMSALHDYRRDRDRECIINGGRGEGTYLARLTFRRSSRRGAPARTGVAVAAADSADAAAPPRPLDAADHPADRPCSPTKSADSSWSWHSSPQAFLNHLAPPPTPPPTPPPPPRLSLPRHNTIPAFLAPSILQLTPLHLSIPTLLLQPSLPFSFPLLLVVDPPPPKTRSGTAELFHQLPVLFPLQLRRLHTSRHPAPPPNYRQRKRNETRREERHAHLPNKAHTRPGRQTRNKMGAIALPSRFPSIAL